METRGQALIKTLLKYFGRDRTNKFLHIISDKRLSDTDRTKEFNKLKKQWQRELKRGAGHKERQTF